MEKSEDFEAWAELESWESVSSEREQWIRLIHCLEGLSLLSNAVGQEHMRKLPPAPWTEKQQRVSEESEAVEGEGLSGEERLSVGNHQFLLLSDGKPFCTSRGEVSCDLFVVSGIVNSHK